MFYHCDVIICHALFINIPLSCNFSTAVCSVAVRALDIPLFCKFSTAVCSVAVRAVYSVAVGVPRVRVRAASGLDLGTHLFVKVP